MTASPQAGVDTNFEQMIRALRNANSLASGTGDLQQGNWAKAQWMLPPNLDGSLFELETFTEPFNRDEANQAFLDAASNGQSPGVTGDHVVSSLQIDYLACLERSFRIRHTLRRSRAFAHAVGRSVGHGSEQGTYTQDLEYIRSLIKEAATPQAPNNGGA